MSTTREEREIQYGLDVNKKQRKHPTSFRLHLCVIFSLILGCLISVTQEVAKETKYSLDGKMVNNFYWPQMGIIWYTKVKSKKGKRAYRQIAMKNTTIFAFIFCLYALGVYYLKSEKRDIHPHLMGSARWATLNDIKEAHLLGKTDGIILGYYLSKNKKRYLIRHSGPEHILMIAPTGSGKGVSIVIPALLTYPESMVIYDLKGENYSLTSAWRKNHLKQKVHKFEPTNNEGTSDCYNPLAQIRLNTEYDTLDAQNIAAIIMEYGDEAQSGDKKSDYFVNAAYGLLVSYLLHTCYKEQREEGKIASLSDVARTLTDPNQDFKEIMEDMQHYPHKDRRPHPVCEEQGASMIKMLDAGAGQQFAGVQGTLESKLNLFKDPILEKNISKSSFKIEDLMNDDVPHSLYICIGSQDKDRLKILTKLIFSQIIRGLTKEVKYEGGVSKPNYKHKLLLLIDEFPSLGKMAVMNEAIAFLRGYGIRCLLIIQDLTQLRTQAAYGPEEAITSNCGIRIAFTPNTIKTAKELSEMIGKTTVTRKTVSDSNTKKLFTPTTGNISVQETGRDLLFPDEVLRLPSIHKDESTGEMIPGAIICFIIGYPPIMGQQMLFFQDDVLLRRSQEGEIKRTPLPSSHMPA